MKKYYIGFFTLALSVSGVFYIAAVNATGAPAIPALSHIPVCVPRGPDTARCHAHVVVDGRGTPQTTTSPVGYGPVQFRSAYGVTGLSSAVVTPVIAIVDAYDDPNIQSDLNTYSAAMGIASLPSCASSPAPCFQKVDQNGGTNYPSSNGGWGLEISLDVEAAHAVCENCSIILVEAVDNSYTNLMAAVDRAYAMGANVVSNSYGSGEFSGETTFDPHFNHPGVAFTFSSGDSGFGAEYPAASKYVTSVGGTTLFLDSLGNYLSEKAWSGSGSGCSSYEAKPAFQHDSGCSRRMIADVSADADPNTGAAVYDSFPYLGQTGWFQVGGTSLASPLVAGMYALGGVGTAVQANGLPYANLTALHDVISGSNGRCKRFPSYFCNALTGYDGPTGLGTPNGFGAF